MTLAERRAAQPFSNGTEGRAWAEVWCACCAKDHDMHNPEGSGGCPIMFSAVVDGGHPQEWLPEPDDGSFALPSRLICTAFVPCESCGGDWHAEKRAQVVASTTAWWESVEEPS